MSRTLYKELKSNDFHYMCILCVRSLVRLHTNVNNSLGRLAPFIFNEWLFHNAHTIDLQKTLSGQDREVFNLDVSKLDWEGYFTHMVQGVRQYLNNEHPRTLPAARRKDFM